MVVKYKDERTSINFLFNKQIETIIQIRNQSRIFVGRTVAHVVRFPP